MNKEYIKDFKLEDLIPYEKNPRKNDLAVDALAKEIQAVGNNDPIEVNENNVILCGHTRLKALSKLGYEITDVIRISGLTEDQQKRYRITNNKTGELAEWDFDLLRLDYEIEELEDMGFVPEDILSEAELKELCRIEIEEDEAPPPPATPQTKKGDIYILGNHRLMCGDSALIEDVEKLMDGQKADMAHNDPPVWNEKGKIRGGGR